MSNIYYNKNSIFSYKIFYPLVYNKKYTHAKFSHFIFTEFTMIHV